MIYTQTNCKITATGQFYLDTYGEQAFLKATDRMIKSSALHEMANTVFWQKVCDYIDDQQNTAYYN